MLAVVFGKFGGLGSLGDKVQRLGSTRDCTAQIAPVRRRMRLLPRRFCSLQIDQGRFGQALQFGPDLLFQRGPFLGLRIGSRTTTSGAWTCDVVILVAAILFDRIALGIKDADLELQPRDLEHFAGPARQSGRHIACTRQVQVLALAGHRAEGDLCSLTVLLGLTPQRLGVFCLVVDQNGGLWRLADAQTECHFPFAREGHVRLQLVDHFRAQSHLRYSVTIARQ